MNFLEKDLETIIHETDNKILNDKGLYIYGKKKRQLRIGNYGIADLVVFDRDYTYCELTHKTNPILNITVVELKKEKVDIFAFLQAISYIKGIKFFFDKHRKNIPINFRIVLIGKYIDTSNSFCYLPDLICSSETNISSEGCITEICLYEYEIDINGLKFNDKSNYNLITPGI